MRTSPATIALILGTRQGLPQRSLFSILSKICSKITTGMHLNADELVDVFIWLFPFIFGMLPPIILIDRREHGVQCPCEVGPLKGTHLLLIYLFPLENLSGMSWWNNKVSLPTSQRKQTAHCHIRGDPFQVLNCYSCTLGILSCVFFTNIIDSFHNVHYRRCF